MGKVSKIIKSSAFVGSVLAPIVFTANDVIISNVTVAKSIMAVPNAHFARIPNSRNVILISHENLLKLMDSGKLPDSVCSKLNKTLFDISYKQYKTDKASILTLN